uniref:Uncharacterized protein n=1 Tax=Mustela putorius furo TaxID=9669 RepID=M3XX17_MUSPF
MCFSASPPPLPDTRVHTHTPPSLPPLAITVGPSPSHLIPSICGIALRACSAEGGPGSCPRKNSPPPSLASPPPPLPSPISALSRPFPPRRPPAPAQPGASAGRQDPRWDTGSSGRRLSPTFQNDPATPTHLPNIYLLTYTCPTYTYLLMPVSNQ